MHLITETCGFRAPGVFEISWERWSFALELIYGDNDDQKWPWMLHFHFLLLNVFLHLPISWVPPSNRETWMREWQLWGVSLCDTSMMYGWGETQKCWDIPFFASVFQRHEVRRADGCWVPFIGSWEKDKGVDGREEFTFPYQYILRRGEVQNRIATVYVERRAWRPKWFTWTGLFEKERQNIDVAFDDEVGERAGSWKGGTVGCGWEMLPGESPEKTLRRMERERVFS
jgi:hypothetical protein